MNQFEKLGIDEDFNPFYAEEKIKAPNQVQKKVIPKLMQNGFASDVKNRSNQIRLEWQTRLRERKNSHLLQ